MRYKGVFWCPLCLEPRRAVQADPDDTADLPDLACDECGYVWGTYYVEHVAGPAEAKPTLDKEARRRGMERLLGQTEEYIMRNGYALENLTQPTARAPRANYG